ncbi:hypothetical protein J6590_031691 [Homalodisca vitripennis]|nr:hypothetical protein J6590_031691 [Homalodisca vitripennis]
MPVQWVRRTGSARDKADNCGSAARDKQITMFIRENVECLDSSFTTTTTIKVSEEKPDLSEEKHLLSAEKTEDNEIPLLQIDKELQQELQHPTAPEASFEIQLKMLKNLVNYQNRLKHILVGAFNNSEKSLHIANEMVKEDGPGFLKQNIDEEKLKQVYNWDDESLDFFRDSVNEIKSVWNNITIVLQNKPSPMEIFFDKKLGLKA